jgi:hypothetical protein
VATAACDLGPQIGDLSTNEALALSTNQTISTNCQTSAPPPVVLRNKQGRGDSVNIFSLELK